MTCSVLGLILLLCWYRMYCSVNVDCTSRDVCQSTRLRDIVKQAQHWQHSELALVGRSHWSQALIFSCHLPRCWHRPITVLTRAAAWYLYQICQSL